MATRTVPFCLEMLTFGPPRELPGALLKFPEIPDGAQPDAGEDMATRTVPFCLEMLTFGHPESSRGHFVVERHCCELYLR